MLNQNYYYQATRTTEFKHDMTAEDEDVILDTDEILRMSKKLELKKIRYLNITSQNYTVISPFDLSCCYNLIELHIPGNHFQEFPRNLHLKKLRILDVSSSKFVFPLIEQFPDLEVVIIDNYSKVNMNFGAVSYFCPNLRIVNGESFCPQISQNFNQIFKITTNQLSEMIQKQWLTAFSENYMKQSTIEERRFCVLSFVAEVTNIDISMDSNVQPYKDLMIFKATMKLLETCAFEADDDYLNDGEHVQSSRRPPHHLSASSSEDEDTKFDYLGSRDSAVYCPKTGRRLDYLDRYIDRNAHELQQLIELEAELRGHPAHNNNIMEPEMSRMIVTAEGADGKPAQYMLEQMVEPQTPVVGFQASQSLINGRSVVMTVLNTSKTPKEMPRVDFLPGELRNTDYVKGHMAGDIYQNVVKNTLRDKTNLKDNGTNGVVTNNKTTNFEGPFPKRRKKYRSKPVVNSHTMDPTTEYYIPPRPKVKQDTFHQRLFELSSNIQKPGQPQFDYDPVHFLRCHKDGSPKPMPNVRVWACQFEPDLYDDTKTTYNVGTCGGDSVNIINCVSGQIINSYRSQGEDFMAMSWSTVRTREGGRMNLLAAAGGNRIVRLHFANTDHFCDLRPCVHTDDVTQITFHRSRPNILFSGDCKGLVLVYDIGMPSTTCLSSLRYQLLRRLRCPSGDVNPVMSLVHLDLYQFLFVACSDAIFSWRLSDLSGTADKRESAPDFEVKMDPRYVQEAESKKGVNIDSVILIDNTILIVKYLDGTPMILYDMAEEFPRRSGISKNLYMEPRGYVEWTGNGKGGPSRTDLDHMTVRSNLGAVMLGDDIGRIWLYDLHRHMKSPSRSPQAKEANEEALLVGPHGAELRVPPLRVLDWPVCTGGETVQGGREETSAVMDELENEVPTVCCVDISYDANYLVAVTENNMVCIWKRFTEED